MRGMMDGPRPPMGMNPRGPFMGGGPGGRFPQMGGPGGPDGMRPFFNNNDNNNGNDNDNQSGMGDSDMRGGVTETKEWPPDDEVNDEDQMDEDERMMDSDDRIRPHNLGLQGPPMNFRGPNAMGSPFGPRGPGGPMGGLLGGPRTHSSIQAQNINTMFSLARMGVPPSQQQSIIAMAGGPGPGLGLGLGGMRLPMSPMGLRPGLVPAGAPPHLLAQPRGPLPIAVSMNGPGLLGSRPAMAVSSAPMSMDSDIPLPDSKDRPQSRQDNDSDNENNDSPSEDHMNDQSSSHPMSIGNNQPPSSAPILGRGFGMTIRPRGGPGLLGMRPGGQGNTFRFGSPGNRPLLGGFGRGDRPHFGSRFGAAPLRPPVGFFDQDQDERKLLPLLDDKPEENEDQNNSNMEVKEKENEVSKKEESRRTGRPSRWSNAEDKADTAPEGESNNDSTPSVVPDMQTPAAEPASAVESNSVVESDPSEMVEKDSSSVPEAESNDTPSAETDHTPVPSVDTDTNILAESGTTCEPVSQNEAEVSLPNENPVTDSVESDPSVNEQPSVNEEPSVNEQMLDIPAPSDNTEITESETDGKNESIEAGELAGNLESTEDGEEGEGDH